MIDEEEIAQEYQNTKKTSIEAFADKMEKEQELLDFKMYFVPLLMVVDEIEDAQKKGAFKKNKVHYINFYRSKGYASGPMLHMALYNEKEEYINQSSLTDRVALENIFKALNICRPGVQTSYPLMVQYSENKEIKRACELLKINDNIKAQVQKCLFRVDNENNALFNYCQMQGAIETKPKSTQVKNKI